jgi:Arc/MetJ-type ribon-helix-helix transcriptional regulator
MQRFGLTAGDLLRTIGLEGSPMTTTGQPGTATLESEVPQRLLGEMQALVAAGWFRSLDEIVVDALRRFVESHRGELMDELIQEDVEWGLRGSD